MWRVQHIDEEALDGFDLFDRAISGIRFVCLADDVFHAVEKDGGFRLDERIGYVIRQRKKGQRLFAIDRACTG
nr:hypothetical protein [Shouchella clausii]